MNAVGADQHVANDSAPVRPVAVEEPGGDAAFVLGEAAEPVAGVQPAFAKPRTHRLVDHALQPAAMHRELRHVVAGVDAARLAPDLLAEAVGVDQLVGADRDRVEPLHQTELLELLDRMRQRVDADAKLADALGLLEQLAVDAAGLQHEGRGESPDSTADDNDLHNRRPSDANTKSAVHYSPAAGRARNRSSVTWLTPGRCKGCPPIRHRNSRKLRPS